MSSNTWRCWPGQPRCCLPQAEREPASTALSAAQRQLVAEVYETLLPRTATPGALDLGLPQYVLKMLADCAPLQEQRIFLAGLGQLDAAAQRQHERSFGASSLAQRTALLQHIDQQPADFTNELGSFYRTDRQLPIDGYTNNKYFMTKQVVHKLVPGHYNGHYSVSKVDLANLRHSQS